MQLSQFFNSLWSIYSAVTPQAEQIKALFQARGEAVINDHVAFRTFAHSPIDLTTLEPVLAQLGYEPYGAFHFTQKHLRARCYRPTTETSAPKIFLSELLTDELPQTCQEVLKKLIQQIPEDAVKGPEIFWQQRLWHMPTLHDYQCLQQHSEYAAWLSTMGMQANHFTVSINHLKTLDGIAEVNQLLLEHGFTLNDSGGLIKGSPELYLEQSSTMADKLTVTFFDGQQRTIPSCFYEFAQRHCQPDGTLFDSFIEGNADKIFDSTNH